MNKTTIGLAGYLFLWLTIFLGKTLYPHAQGFFQGMRGAEHAWPERFSEHERLQRFVALTFPWAAAAEGQVLFAYGGDPEFEKIDHFVATSKYLLYPARMFTHATGVATTISHIAVYHTREAFHHLPFCHQVGEKSYLCQVSPAEGPLQAHDVRVQYKAPDLTIMAQANEAGQLDPAFLIVSLKEVPVNVLLTRQSTIDSPRAGTSSYRMHLTIPIPAAALPVYRFHLLVVDKRGLLSASEEHRLVFTP